MEYNREQLIERLQTNLDAWHTKNAVVLIPLEPKPDKPCLREIVAELRKTESSESHVMTYDELNGLHPDDVIWLEDIDKTEIIPAIVCGAPGYSSVVDAVELCAYYRDKYIRATTKDYLERWRCWTSRPDEKVRAETPWEK